MASPPEDCSPDPTSSESDAEPPPAWLGDVAPPMPVIPLPQPGDHIEHYTVIRRVGEGAFGRVYQVFNNHLQRHETLKLSRFRGHAAPSELRLDLPRGVRIQVLSHHGDFKGYRYLAYYPFLEGESLGQHLSRARLTETEALRVSHDLAVLLRDLHANNVIHRDIKPSNVLVEPRGDVWLLDFGLASTGAESGHEQGPCGTPGYVAPEQARGEPVDSRSDVFSAAVLLFACMGGAVPGSGVRTNQPARLLAAVIGASELRSLDASRATKKLIASGCRLEVAERLDITAWEEQLGKLRLHKRNPRPRGTLVAILITALCSAGLTHAYVRYAGSSFSLHR